MAKDVIVLVFDVCPTMDEAPPTGDGTTPLESSLHVANQVVFQKIFAGAKDDVGVVLFGTRDTDNELAGDHGGYDNISVGWSLTTTTIDLIKYLKEHVKTGPGYADCIHAVVVAMDLIVKHSLSASKKVGEKKIYLFTDASSRCSDGQLDEIITTLKDNDITLIVVGPQLETQDDSEDEPGPSSGRDSSSNGRGHPPLKKTPEQEEGEKVLTRLVHESEGSSFSFSEAMNVASFIRKNAKKQTSRFVGCLEVGSGLKIPCKIFTKTMLERPSTWKKLSAISQSSANPGTMAVRIERSYHLQDEDETEVEQEDAVKGYRYGKSLIPVSSEDEEAMKLQPSKCLTLLGFTSMDNVKQEHIIGSSVQVVTGNPDSEPALVSLSAIIHALYETKMAAIVRYVFRNNASPRLCALVPHIKSNYECMFLYQLPFMEDVRQYSFSSLSANPKLQPSDEQLQAMDELISSMELSEEDLETKRLGNPVIQRTFQCMEHRVLHPDDPLPEIDPTLERYLNPNEMLMNQCSQNVLKVKNMFPLTVIEKKSKVGGASDVWQQTSGINLDTEEQIDAPPTKRSKPNEDEDFSVTSLAKGDVKEIGTVDPVGDYSKLIDSINFKEATSQLQQVILRLIKESFGNVMYPKALDCTKAMRQEAIKVSQPSIFNDFLKKLRDEIQGTRYSPFWDTITESNVSLITSEECSSSNVTSNEANEFLVGQAEPAVSEVEEKEEEEEADDLLAMMD